MTKKIRVPKSYKLGNDKDGKTIIIPTDGSVELTQKDIDKKNVAQILKLKMELMNKRGALSILYTELGKTQEYEKDFGSTNKELFGRNKQEVFPDPNEDDFAEISKNSDFPVITMTSFAPAIIQISGGNYSAIVRTLTISEKEEIEDKIKLKKDEIQKINDEIKQLLPKATMQNIREATAKKRECEPHKNKKLKEKYIEEYKTSRIKSKRSFAENRKKDPTYAHLKMDTLRRWLIGVSKVVIPQCNLSHPHPQYTQASKGE